MNNLEATSLPQSGFDNSFSRLKKAAKKKSALECFLIMVANIFDAYTAALFIRDSADKGCYTLRAVQSLSRHIAPDCRIAAGQGLVGWVAREGKMLHATHFEHDTRTLGVYTRDVGIKAFLAAPFPGRQGVLMVDSRNRYAFTPKKQQILQNCAETASELWSALARKTELSFYRRWHRWQHAVSDTPAGQLDNLVSLLDFDRGLVAYHETGKKYFSVLSLIGWSHGANCRNRRFNVGQGLTGWVFKHRQHLVLSKLGEHRERSYILFQGDRLDRGPALVGIYFPVASGALAWILSGNTSPSLWPEDFADLLTSAMDRIYSKGGSIGS